MAAVEQALFKCIGCRKKFNSEGYSVNRHGTQLKTCIECQRRKQAKAAAKREAKQQAAEEKEQTKKFNVWKSIIEEIKLNKEKNDKARKEKELREYHEYIENLMKQPPDFEFDFYQSTKEDDEVIEEILNICDMLDYGENCDRDDYEYNDWD